MMVPMLLGGETIEAEILPDHGMSIVSLCDSSGREQLWRHHRPPSPPNRATASPSSR